MLKKTYFRVCAGCILNFTYEIKMSKNNPF